MESDKRFNIAWGGVLVFLGIGVVLWLGGMAAAGIFVFLVGSGGMLIALSGGDSTRFYGGVAIVSVGIVLAGIVAKLNVLYFIAVLLVFVGAVIILKNAGGKKNE